MERRNSYSGGHEGKLELGELAMAAHAAVARRQVEQSQEAMAISPDADTTERDAILRRAVEQEPPINLTSERIEALRDK